MMAAANEIVGHAELAATNGPMCSGHANVGFVNRPETGRTDVDLRTVELS